MATQPTFQDLQREFLLSGGYIKFFHLAQHSNGTVKELFAHLWSLPEAHLCLTPKVTPNAKFQIDAENLQAKGDEYFEKGDLEKALECYNLSIMAAPHPSKPLGIGLSQNGTKSHSSFIWQEQHGIYLNEGTDRTPPVCLHHEDEKFETLVLGFVKRSAVLFAMEEYETCLYDIEAAIRCGCSAKWRSVLAKRKLKCLMAMDEVSISKQLSETPLELENVDVLQEIHDTQAHTELSQLTRDKPEYSFESNRFPLNDQLPFFYHNPEKPKLLKRNPTIPSLSDAVTMKYTSSQGRHLVATKDINPGNIL